MEMEMEMDINDYEMVIDDADLNCEQCKCVFTLNQIGCSEVHMLCPECNKKDMEEHHHPIISDSNEGIKLN